MYVLSLFIICVVIIILLLTNDMSVIKVVWPGCQTASAKRKLSTVQRLASLVIKGAMRIIPSNAVEAHIWLPPLELVVQSEARSAARRLLSLGLSSYLQTNRGHSSILMRLQQTDPVFNKKFVVMRTAHIFESQYRIIMLTKENWTMQLVLILQSKGSSVLQRVPS